MKNVNITPKIWDMKYNWTISIIMMILTLPTKFINKVWNMFVNIVNIRQLRNTAFFNMYNLCRKELLTVVSIVTIRLNGNQPSRTCAISAWRIIYSCEVRDHMAKFKSRHLQHVQYLHEGISNSCEYCDYKAKWKCSLFQHVQFVHKRVNYSCEHCDHKAKQKRNLLWHVQSMHEGVPYSLEHCENKAKQKSDLFHHVQSLHEGITCSCEHWDHKTKRKANFSNLCDLYMKELLLIVIIIIIRLNGKATFYNMCDLCMKELLLIVSIMILKQITKEVLAAI